MGDNVISFRNSLPPTILTLNLSIYISTPICLHKHIHPDIIDHIKYNIF